MDKAKTHAEITDERIKSLADYYDNTDLGETPWDEGGEIQRPELEQISLRLPKEDLEFLKRRAAKLGVGYTTLLRMIVREHVRSSLRLGEPG
jgi:predicted DNA binding CopG/RHH family protein